MSDNASASVYSSCDCVDLCLTCRINMENGDIWSIRIERDGYTREDEVTVSFGNGKTCSRVFDQTKEGQPGVMLADILERGARFSDGLSSPCVLCEKDRNDCIDLVRRMAG